MFLEGHARNLRYTDEPVWSALRFLQLLHAHQGFIFPPSHTAAISYREGLITASPVSATQWALSKYLSSKCVLMSSSVCLSIPLGHYLPISHEHSLPFKDVGKDWKGGTLFIFYQSVQLTLVVITAQLNL